jgi:hypothetical protein
MKTDRVFVLLLVVLLPLSGCFDGSVGDADAADDSSESTAVINNYYNNTTTATTTVIQESPEMIALGGIVSGSDAVSSVHNITATINTVAGEMIQIHDADADGGETSYMYVITTCSNGAEFDSGQIGGEQFTFTTYVAGSAFDCTHEIDIVDGDLIDEDISWSFVYSILPVTVG